MGTSQRLKLNMPLMQLTSPHTKNNVSTQKMMLEVIGATLLGAGILTYHFGWGILINVLWASLVALGCEALVLKIRRKPISFYLRDGSALVTALLLALAIPPTAPWWLTLVGTAFAIIIAKQLYGGLGYNPFNPAMAGYALLLISYPVEMTSWLPPRSIAEHTQAHSLQGALQLFWSGAISTQTGLKTVDAFTSATTLDTLKTARTLSLTLEEATAQNPVLGSLSGWMVAPGWFWSNLAFLTGGLYLLKRKHITWHIPLSFLSALTVTASIAYYFKPTLGSPIFHLFSGATMLCAFFIATDPVSAATSQQGKLIYGTGIGLLTYIIRTFGGYPDAVAFAVLLLNLAAPTIDYYTQPRSYGHKKAKKGLHSL